MRLLVDLQACQGPSGTRGIGYYASSLTLALHEGRGEHEVVVLLDAEVPAEDLLALRARLAPLGRDGVVHFSAPPQELRPRCVDDTEAAREAAVRALQPDVVLLTSVFELMPTGPMSVDRWCGAVPTAAVLYDLIPLTDLALHKPDPARRREYLAALEHLTRTQLLLAISEHSARQARDLLDDCPPVTVVHGAARPPVEPVRPPSAPDGGFVLTVGLDEPRKDLPTVVRAWGRVPAAERAGRPVVVVGHWNEQEKAGLRAVARCAGLPPEGLRFLGRVDDAGLDWLYGAADVFVFASLEEGLGLPPLEAMRAGTPTLLARSSSLVELSDCDAGYFPPGDDAALAVLLRRVLREQPLRDELVAAGSASAARFTWASTAERTWEALERLPATQRSADRPRLALLGPTPPEAATALDARYEVVDVPRADRVLHVVDGEDLALLDADRLHDTVGVLALASPVHDLPPDPRLLAPVLGALVPDTGTARALLRAGLTSAAVHVAPPADWPSALEAVYATDPADHWLRAGTEQAHLPAVHAPLATRPRWANRSRGRLLASDVTIYRSTAFLSGIQRTAARLHRVLDDLLAPEGGAIVPVQLGETPEGTPHPVIRRDPVLSAATAEPDEVDWVLCIDLNGHVMSATDRLQAARARGTGVVTNVFDLLPWSNPEWWPPGAASGTFVPWVHHSLLVSDVLLVNSEATADALERFVAQHAPRRPDPFEVQLLRLGADLGHDGPTATATREPDHFLMVGTIEPRKGHAEVLDAFERLWADGGTARLTVLGRAGWMVDEVVARMEALDGGQPHFAWLRNASDDELDVLYATCTAVVLASQGEGFGLPVVEAAVRGCPVVVRDIPVLRELAGDDATYFDEARPLESVLRTVLSQGAAVPSLERVHTWDEVGRRLLGVLDGQVEPLARWTPDGGWAWS